MARCCPSRASILTGQYPHKVGVGHMVADLGQPGYRGRLSEEGATLAEVLAPAGYRTFLSGKWHVGTNDPTQRGFEEFYGTLISAPTFWDPARYLRLPAGRKARTYGSGDLLRHRRVDRSRAGFPRAGSPNARQAMVPVPGLQLTALSAARAAGGHCKIRRPVRARLGCVARRAVGADEAAAAGGRETPNFRRVRNTGRSARPNRVKIRPGTLLRRTGGETWQGAWPSMRRWSIGWTRTSAGS